MQSDPFSPLRHRPDSPFAFAGTRTRFLWGVLISVLLATGIIVEVVHGMPRWLAAFPLAASLFVCGMPHGAMDWHIHRRLLGDRSLGLAMLAFIPYTAIGILCTLVLYAAPVGYIAFFLLLSVVHFGRVDARIRIGKAAVGTPETIRGVARAAAVVMLPFAFWPIATANAIGKVSALVGGPATLPVGLAHVFGVLGFIGIMLWLFDAAVVSREDFPIVRLLPLAVLLTSAVLPPLFSVGVWFLLWHAVRECMVLGERPFRPLRSVGRAHRRSLPLMLPTLTLAAALGIYAGVSVSVSGVAVVTLTLYAILTPPHHLLHELSAATTDRRKPVLRRSGRKRVGRHRRGGTRSPRRDDAAVVSSGRSIGLG